MELHIPELKKPGKGTFRTGEEDVRRWIEGLPLVNIDATVTLLEGALDEINGYILPGAERLQTLEQFARPVAHVNDSLRKKFLGRPIPLQGSALEHAQKAIDLCLRMASGYKLLAVLLDRDAAAGPQMATAIQRAIRYYGEMLLNNYQTYAGYPEGIWSDLHALYALADKHGLAKQAIADPMTPDATGVTIEDSYKKILLLSLACPYRLRQNEIRQVSDLLTGWAPYSKLLADADPDESGYFDCHLDRDEPPGYTALRPPGGADARRRFLSTRDMATPVNATLAAQRSAHQRIGLPEEKTLQRLLMSWGVMPKRRFARQPKQDEVSLTPGLDHIHELIATPVPADTSSQEEDVTIRDSAYLRDPTFEQSTVINVDWLTGIDNSAASAADAEARRKAFPGAIIQSAEKASNEIWKVQDISAGGYSLRQEGEASSAVRIGELVAINFTGETPPGSPQLGVVRWMKSTPQRGLEMGVEMLAPGASAVEATLCDEKSRTGNPMKGILLPEVRPLNRPATLLLPSLPFHTGCTTTLRQGEQDQEVTLTRQLENTGRFAQYLFAPAQDA